MYSASRETHSKASSRTTVHRLGAIEDSVGEIVQSAKNKDASKLSHAALNKTISPDNLEPSGDQMILPKIIWSD